MTFNIRRPTTAAEVTECIDLYLALNDFSFLPASRPKSIRELSTAVRMNKLVLMALLDDKIVGWIYAREANISHIENSVLQQYYYASNLTGIKAVKLLSVLHQAMFDYAEDKGFELVMSSGSHMDSKNVLTRVLAKDGWDTRGYLAVKYTKNFKER